MSHTGTSGMHAGTSQIFLRHVFTRHGLHHLRPGKEHVRGTFHHQGEVSQGGRIYRTSCTRAKNTGNLRNYSRSQNVTLKNLCIACQRVDTFLNPGTTRVIQSDARSPHLHGHIHHFTDFQGHGFGKGTGRHGEILSKHINQTTFDCSVSGYDAVSQIMLLVHPEVCATMLYEHVHFFKAAFVKEHGNTFAGCVLTFIVLFFDGFRTSTQTGLCAKLY